MKRTLLLLISMLSCILVKAQTDGYAVDGERYRKSTEIGLGVDMHMLNRVGFQNYTSSPAGDSYTIKMRNAMFGGNLYLARELNPWLYIDLQGTLGKAKALDVNASGVPSDKDKWFAMVGPGLQLRLTPLFRNKFVEPYFRVGANWYHKDFLVMRSNRIENFQGDYLQWTQTDEFNKNADTEKSYFPFSFGFGINSWFGDHFGFGIQGDYLTAFNSKTVSFPRVLARLMIRFGSSKRPVAAPVYIEKVVTREIPGERIVEKEIVYQTTTPDSLMVLFGNINFDFDKSTLTDQSQTVLDGIVPILMSKEMSGKKFLIFGFTDRVGSVEYNNELSERRAKTVVEALVARGVPSTMLKSWGVGKCAAIMPATETEHAREGDRKVTVELVTNQEYWDKLP